ncbi:STN domain-containing protein [Chitinophaga sp. 22536]|uniref:STN domain-containing protein n=1 Tax=unclassified Chitinophaga TaxID=2619133 RepID=UPI003F8656EA
MKTHLLILWLFSLSPHSSSNQAEKIKVSVNVRNVPLREVFRQISQQTGLRFFGSNTTPYDAKVSLQQTGTELRSLLDEILQPLHCSWEISGKVIIISTKNTSPTAPVTDVLSRNASRSP